MSVSVPPAEASPILCTHSIFLAHTPTENNLLHPQKVQLNRLYQTFSGKLLNIFVSVLGYIVSTFIQSMSFLHINFYHFFSNFLHFVDTKWNMLNMGEVWVIAAIKQICIQLIYNVQSIGIDSKLPIRLAYQAF